MNFEMSDDRRMLSDMLRRYLGETCPIESRSDLAYSAPWHDPSCLQGLAELGLFQALAPEASGGMGGTGFDIATVFEELGRALCPEPVLPVVMAVPLLAHDPDALAPILSGERRVAVALGEQDAPYDMSEIETRAQAAGDGWHLTGRKSVVYGAGDGVDALLVAARIETGLALFEVTADAAEIAAYGMIDGGLAAEVFLDHSPARLVAADAARPLADAADRAALALSAEALGAMETTLGYVYDYLLTRKQFGTPIGAFQALQHRAVDLSIELEQARSIVILAADALGGAQQAKRVSQAKHLVGRIARQVAEEAIQMHGGIGMTWEYPVSHLAKRLVMIDHQMGDTDWHLERMINALQQG